MLANFSKSSAGATDLEVPVCAVVTPEATASSSASSQGHLVCLSSECPLRCPLIGQGFSSGPLLLKSQDGILLFLSWAVSPRVQRLRAAVLSLLSGGSLRRSYDCVSVQCLPHSTQSLDDGASSSLLPRKKLLADEVVV